MGSQLNSDTVDNPLYNIQLNQIMTPALPNIYPFNDERVYKRVLPQRAFPELGLYSDGYEKQPDSNFLINIKSNIDAFALQIRNDSESWSDVQDWRSGDSITVPSNGKLVYLRAQTAGDLYTSTMVIQMP